MARARSPRKLRKRLGPLLSLTKNPRRTGRQHGPGACVACGEGSPPAWSGAPVVTQGTQTSESRSARQPLSGFVYPRRTPALGQGVGHWLGREDKPVVSAYLKGGMGGEIPFSYIALEAHSGRTLGRAGRDPLTRNQQINRSLPLLLSRRAPGITHRLRLPKKGIPPSPGTPRLLSGRPLKILET
ncbi:MAG: hypothetical protein VX941_08630 [Pseudomonadota bacterium]|nr:hypothetical protein [Pseudomonadota bacterium]